jgi:hypothetical protein
MIINGVSFIGSWGLAGTANVAFTDDPAYYQAPIVQSNAAPTVTYSISPASGSVNEGSTVALNVTTTNLGSGTLYWTINNVSTSNADFSAYNGSVTITGDAGSFTVGPIADTTTEGAETFTVQLRTGSTSGTVVATSSSITVNDTSVANANVIATTYAVTSNVATVSEGNVVLFTVATANVASNTTLYWTVNNISTSNVDFLSNVVAGSFTISANTGTYSVTALTDYLTEGSETFTTQVRTGSVTGTVVATSNTITISDTSLSNATPTTYAIVESASTVGEGNSITFTVTTANVASNTSLYWTVNNISTSNADFTANSGSFVVTSNVGTITLTTISDYTTEGSETFNIQVRTVSIGGSIVATSNTITVNDTSVANATPTTYAVTSNVSTVSEGNVVLFTVTTANVASNTTLYWTVNNISTSNVDFVSNTVSGSFTISANTGTYSVTAKTDYLTEGSETFTTDVRTVSITGTVVATSNAITISDTSLSNATPTTYSLTSNVSSVNEGNAILFTMTTANVASNTTLYYSAEPTFPGGNTATTAQDFTGNVSTGSFVINSNSGTFTLIPRIDGVSEPVEYFTVYARTGSTSGPNVANVTCWITSNAT